MKRLMVYIKPYIGRISLGLFIKFLGTISELWLPWILAYLIDDVAPRGYSGWLYFWGAAMLICSIVCYVANVSANRMASKSAMFVTRSIRHDLFARISHLSSAQIDFITVPSLVSRLTTDTYNFHQMVNMVQRLGVRAPILVLGGIIMTLTLDVSLSLVMICTMPLIFIFVMMVTMKGIPVFKKLQGAIDGLVRVVRENVTGARVIKALSKNDYEIDRFRRQNKSVSSYEIRANVIMSLSHPIMNVILYAGLVAVIFLGAWRVDQNLSQTGNIIAFLSYFTIIANAMMGITRIFVIYSRSSASAARISEILDMPEDLKILDMPKNEADSSFVRFDDVTFSYNKRMPAVENISFSLQKGESIGIIGATGSGKSTVAMLLMRFYDVDQGTVSIGGRDVRSIPKEELHKMFGVAFQNDMVFSDTVRQNITLGREITDDEINFAATNAQARHFIENLENRYDEHLNTQGTNLSGGQRQRLLITRALAGNPDILILDDSSSALDYRTDADLRLALLSNYSSVTTVMIASRVSSIAHCTKIMMLDQGRILGIGTHEELLKTCPAYKEIADIQLGGMDHE